VKNLVGGLSRSRMPKKIPFGMYEPRFKNTTFKAAKISRSTVEKSEKILGHTNLIVSLTDF
jgi:hypothetical protein